MTSDSHDDSDNNDNHSSYMLVPKSYTRWIQEIMFCRTLVFMWLSGVLSGGPSMFWDFRLLSSALGIPDVG